MKLTRRWVLKGVGTTVAIPLLPSLLTAEEARGQASAFEPRHFVSFRTRHGNVSPANIFPLMGANAQTQVYAGRTISQSPLSLSVANGIASLSKVYSASSSVFTERLKQKFHSIRGIEIGLDVGHNSAGTLGNFGTSANEGSFGDRLRAEAKRVTIDQLIGWSSSFYPSMAGVKTRTLALSNGSYTWENPVTRTGYQASASKNTPRAVFDYLFGGVTTPAPDGGPSRPLLVDDVIEDYRAMKQNPRLSAEDKDRLEQHLQRLYEVQREIQAQAEAPASGCQVPTAPAAPHATVSADALDTASGYRAPAMQGTWGRIMNDLIVAALSCGSTRVITMSMMGYMADYEGAWHPDVAHKSTGEYGQGRLTEGYRFFFAEIFVDLASKMDAVKLPNGKTLLDQSLVTWMHEYGCAGEHKQRDMPVCGFGSAGGALKTGAFIDYRNRAADMGPGLLWQQYMDTILRAMRVPKSEYEKPEICGGYPDYTYLHRVGKDDADIQRLYASAWPVTGEKLPWFAV